MTQKTKDSGRVLE
uniref:Uncharacterized protein n=1 Tax=Anguilla anguilla TaxID=7936 RepID=A0A0E9PMB8_ANGAN